MPYSSNHKASKGEKPHRLDMKEVAKMAKTIDFTPSDSGDIRDIIAAKLVDSYNAAVEAVIEFKEQGDVDEKQDEILSNVEPVKPTPEQMQASKNRGDDDEDPFSIENYKFLVNYHKEQLEAATENLKNAAYEQAKAGINEEFDIDQARLNISELRKEWSNNYSAAFEMLKMAGSIEEEKTTDPETGKTTTEFVPNDKWGEIVLQASSVPSIRRKRGEGGGSSQATSEGAKIRAWGRENGWASLNDRGPLPSELKEAYAAAHA